MKDLVVILGVGNLLRGDDGIGVHAAQALAQDPPPGACVVDAGTDMLSALPHLAGAARALVIDAVQGGGRPGTLYRLAESDLAPGQASAAAHAVNLLAARRLLPPGTAWPAVTVLGVEPASLDYGMTLSPPVAAALPALLARAREIAADWRLNPFINEPRMACL